MTTWTWDDVDDTFGMAICEGCGYVGHFEEGDGRPVTECTLHSEYQSHPEECPGVNRYVEDDEDDDDEPEAANPVAKRFFEQLWGAS